MTTRRGRASRTPAHWACFVSWLGIDGRSRSHLLVVGRDGERMLDGDLDPWVRVAECGVRIGEVLRRVDAPPPAAFHASDYCADCVRVYRERKAAYDAGTMPSSERARRDAARPLVRVPHRTSKPRSEEP